MNLYRAAGAPYRRILAAIGRARLNRCLADGLPEHFRRPLESLLAPHLHPDERRIVDTVERLRIAMSTAGDTVEVYTSPAAGSARATHGRECRPAPGALRIVPLAEIANTACVPAYWGAFLHLLANAVRAGAILELGGCAGISGCYLVCGRHCKSFITVEGSRGLADLARRNLEHVANNYTVLNELFDDALDEVLPRLDAELDLVHIDGQHEKIATLHYLTRVAPHLSEGAVVVFDDIRWTPDMWDTWAAVKTWPGFALTIDVGRYGLCVWARASERPVHYDFSTYTDYWKKGK